MANEITSRHELTDPLGPTSPLGALYRLGAKVLLIGVDFNRCTALHLAEHIVWPDRSTVFEGGPMYVEGKRHWVEFEVPKLMDDDEFLTVGAAAREAELVREGKIAEAPAILASLPALVDFAVERWHRTEHPFQLVRNS